MPEKMSRRKYVAAVGGIAAVAVVGGASVYYLTRPPAPSELSIFGHGPGAEETVMRECVNRYQQENPNVDFNMEWVGGTGYLDALKTNVLAGTQSDIMWTNTGTHGEPFIELGVIQNLTDFYEEFDIWDRIIGGDPAGNPVSAAVLVSYTPGTPPVYEFPPKPNAEPYWVPTSMLGWGMYYNPAIFDEYGVDANIQTWDELSAACETFKKAGVIPTALSAAEPWEREHFFDILLVNVAGGCIDHPELGAEVQKGDAAWTDEPFMKAMEYYQDYRDQGYFQQGALGMEPDAVTLLFTEGKSAMYCQGSWMVSTIRETAPAFEFDLLPDCWPSIRTDKKKYIIGGCCDGWGINSESENMDDLYDFLEFMTRPEQMSAYPEIMKIPCAYKNVTPLEDPLGNKFVAMFPNMHIWTDITWHESMRDRLRLNLGKFINFEMSGEEVLTDLEAHSETVR